MPVEASVSTATSALFAGSGSLKSRPSLCRALTWFVLFHLPPIGLLVGAILSSAIKY
jgi:hypothetical protein